MVVAILQLYKEKTMFQYIQNSHRLQPFYYIIYFIPFHLTGSLHQIICRECVPNGPQRIQPNLNYTETTRPTGKHTYGHLE